ncbi:hypothetical protein MMC30_006480 [Trapelia coarctata]|nr:hypothetical protein [Trapelia coarctata]
MASSSRPQLSITLPRNLAFNFNEGEEFKTPEPEEVAKLVPRPVYRVKRRARPSIISSDAFASTSLTTSEEPAPTTEDVPLPSIELPTSSEQVQPALLPHITALQPGFLSPPFAQRTMDLPRTPSAQPASHVDDWDTAGQKALGESISRPMSVCSILSDSSDDSDAGSEDYMSLGGSCTSPESDSDDPFTCAIPWKKNAIPMFESGLKSTKELQAKGKGKATKPKPIRWTSKMDTHLWTCYQIYIQDPTHTPFKLIPGSPPPLGVCHRVTRRARTTWPGEKVTTYVSSDFADASQLKTTVNREDSPDTLKAQRSGSTTPTAHPVKKIPSWPKSNASTRRRLRELCRRKATMPAHYQRLLQSRSPTPFASSSRSHSRSARISSPQNDTMKTPTFQTDELQLSLITSTATSMRPGGPLAQLVKSSPRQDAWFNDPNVPWASPAPVPSEVDQTMDDEDSETSLPRFRTPSGSHSWGPIRSRQHTRPTLSNLVSDVGVPGNSAQGIDNSAAIEAMVLAGLRAPFGPQTWSPRQLRQPSYSTAPTAQWQFDAQGNSLHEETNNAADVGQNLPRLRSPFGNQTWGPSRSRQPVRPTTPVSQSDVHTQVPEPTTPVRFHGTFPHAINQKRRAQNQLEDEMSPGGTDLNKSALQDASAIVSSSSRRVRIRGATTGGANIQELMPDLFRIPNHPTASLTTSSHVDPPRPLASPFSGINPRPSLGPRRHVPSLSLPSFDAQGFSSIDQLVHQAVSENMQNEVQKVEKDGAPLYHVR